MNMTFELTGNLGVLGTILIVTIIIMLAYILYQGK